MDADEAVAQQLTAAESWGGRTRPHDVAWVLSLLMPLLPLDARARAACVCRAWRVATAAPPLWEELSFERCAAGVSDAALAALCARAGAALRELRLDSDACTGVTSAGMPAALRDGGCTGVRRLWGPPRDEYSAERWTKELLTTEMVQQLAVACPMMEHAACSVRCHLSHAAAVVTALPGPLELTCDSFSDAGATQLAERLRASTALTSLDLSFNSIGDAAMTNLAECLRFNATLTTLVLAGNRIGDTGATRLAESLRINATLTRLNLSFNEIGAAGATQLAESLRNNITLTSFSLSLNNIGDAGARALRAACPPQCRLFL